MHLCPKALAVFALALMSTDCKSFGPHPHEAASCAAGSPCSLVGRLTVYRGAPASIAELDTGGQCVAVAMSRADFERLGHVRGLKARVSGVAMAEASADNLVSYRLRDRLVAPSNCRSGIVIYADAVRLIGT
jgi:hypothetical protein